MADLYNNISHIYYADLNLTLKKAWGYCKKLWIYQKIFKEDNKDVADVYGDIASAHYPRNDYNLALVMLQKSLAI